MKIACMFKDETLCAKFREDRLAREDEFTFFEEPDQILMAQRDSEWDHVVLSDRCFSLSGIADFLEELKGHKDHIRIIILLSNQHDSLLNEKYIKFCLSKGYTYIMPGQTASSIVREVNKIIHASEGEKERTRKNIVLFLGSTPNIGTTLTSFGASLRLADVTEQQIAYLCLNLKSSKVHTYLGISEPSASLDGLRAELRSNSLTKARLMRYCHSIREHPNLHVLFGNLQREQAEYYTPEDIQHLLEVASQTFDLCLVEVNAYWDNAATVCASLLAGTRILVTTPQLGHFQEDISRWLKNLSPILHLDENGFDVFITQHCGKGLLGDQGTFTIKEVRKAMGMNVIGRMGLHSQVAPMLNQGRIVDLIMEEGMIAKELTGLVHTLSTLYELRLKKDKTPRKTWRHRLFSIPAHHNQSV